jgi:hypothetical protein
LSPSHLPQWQYPLSDFLWKLLYGNKEDFENNISEVVSDNNTIDIFTFSELAIPISHVIREYAQYFKRISVFITGSQVTSD